MKNETVMIVVHVCILVKFTKFIFISHTIKRISFCSTLYVDTNALFLKASKASASQQNNAFSQYKRPVLQKARDNVSLSII